MEEIITVAYDNNEPDDSCLLCMRTLKDGRHSISVVYTQHNADEMYKMLTKQGYLKEHDAKIRQDAIDECLSVVEWDGYTFDIKERIEKLKEKRIK